MKVGITGGIGSGKTTVCKVFELLGIPVFYADEEAKKLMIQDEDLIAEVKSVFGTESYLENGALNRKYLAARVFTDPKELERLNSLVHPAVFKAFDRWTQMQGTPYVLKEAALLFESGSYRDCDHTILVTAPIELRVQRVMKRDNLSEAEVQNRIRRQLTDEAKGKLAGFVLTNDEKHLLIPEILSLHLRFLKQANTND